MKKVARKLTLLFMVTMLIAVTVFPAGADTVDGYTAGSSGDGFTAGFYARQSIDGTKGTEAYIRIMVSDIPSAVRLVDGEVEIPYMFDVTGVEINGVSGGTMSYNSVARVATDRKDPSGSWYWTWNNGNKPNGPTDGFWSYKSVTPAWDWYNNVADGYSGYWTGQNADETGNPNVLRFTYTNTSNSPLGFDTYHDGSRYCDVIIRLVLNTNIDETLIALPQLLRFGMINDPANEAEFDFQVETKQGDDEILITNDFAGEVWMDYRELYTGDDVDLIPANKTAYAVEFNGLNGTPAITWMGQTLHYSPEMTAVRGKPNYVFVTNTVTNVGDFYMPSYYAIDANSTAMPFFFGDTDYNQVINAQDALNTLSAWLRKTDAPDNNGILAMNVNGDARIDNRDTVIIMDMYTGKTAPIVEK